MLYGRIRRHNASRLQCALNGGPYGRAFNGNLMNVNHPECGVSSFIAEGAELLVARARVFILSLFL